MKIEKRILDQIENNLDVRWGKATNNGVFTCEAYIHDLPQPVGLVWYGFFGGNKTIVILDSYVMEKYRRLGIRTKIHNVMIESYKNCISTIMTQAGTKYSLPWLKKMKFKQNQDGDWILKL